MPRKEVVSQYENVSEILKIELREIQNRRFELRQKKIKINE